MDTTDLTKINYGDLISNAMIQVVRKALLLVQKTGKLPGQHYFFITFATDNVEVVIPQHLKVQYPERLTIVLQHQFSNLQVAEEWFSVSLSFEGVKSSIKVPFSAILHFSDPSVKFDLHFQFGITLMKKIDQIINKSKDSLDNRGEKSTKKAKSEKNNILSLDDYRDKIGDVE